jgi:hypothetical protein
VQIICYYVFCFYLCEAVMILLFPVKETSVINSLWIFNYFV